MHNTLVPRGSINLELTNSMSILMGESLIYIVKEAGNFCTFNCFVFLVVSCLGGRYVGVWVCVSEWVLV